MTKERELECVIADLKAEVIALREQLSNAMQVVASVERERDAALKTDQEPVAWMHENEGLSYENHYAGSVPLYIHPVVSSEPVAYAHYEKGRLVLLGRNDACMDMLPLYLHPSRHLSDDEIIAIWDQEAQSTYFLFNMIVSFARAVLKEASK